MKSLVLTVLSLSLLVSIASAQEAAPVEVAATKVAAPQFQERNPRYTVRSADSFDVNFELSPEFNQTVVVQPDGFITLKAIGDVHVAGLTVPELTRVLHDRYAKVLNDPIISVVLKDFEKPYFIADGQVQRPGKYELRGDITLTEAIAIAGGFNDASKHSQVLLFRRVNEEWMSAEIVNVKKMLKNGNLHEDVQLRAGDMVFVPKNTVSKIRPFLPSTGMGAYTNLLH